MAGLFPPESCQYLLNEWQQEHAIPPIDVSPLDGENALPDCYSVIPIQAEGEATDYELHINHADCPAYIDLHNELKNDDI